MAITLAPDHLSDAALTDRIGVGEVESAARLWVRLWPTAVAAARRYVDPAEVPGLAAEALIGTIATIAIGRGPREDVLGFVTAAVRELGEDDEPAQPAPPGPEVFASPLFGRAFAELDDDTRRSLVHLAETNAVDADGTRALTVLQHYYLAEHADRAESDACRRPHVGLMAVAEGSTRELSGATWVHLSICYWCTEAFHEVAFSNVELGTLLGAAALVPVPAPAPAPTPTPAPSGPPVPDEPLIPGLVAVTPVALDEVAAESAGSPTRRGRPRGRIVAAAALTAAAVAVVAAVLTSGDDQTVPTASGTQTTGTGAPTSAPSDPFGTSASPPFSVPTASRSTARPSRTESRAATTSATSPTSGPTAGTTPKAAPKPTPKPTPKPPATSPPSTPTASPTAKPCNGLQHLLGIC